MYHNFRLNTNEGDDLVFETNGSNEHWSAVLKIKEGEKLCKYCSGSFNKTNATIRQWKKKSFQL